MVLFFVVSLVAAYSSRNLIFEQKTAANQYRSTAALEAAEAGLNWAVSMLNSGRIDASCQPSVAPTTDSFRERYLSIDDDGVITRRTLPAPSTDPLTPSCVFDGTAWQCDCPDASTPALPSVAGTDMAPAFRVRFLETTMWPGRVRIEVNGCTRADDACLDFPAGGLDNEGRVRVTALLALKPGVATVPVAALTARGSVDLGGTGNLTLVNQTRSGVTVLTGSNAPNLTGATLSTAPGSPGASSVRDNDSTLSSLGVPAPGIPTASDAMFARTFGLWPDDYGEQPGAVDLKIEFCSGTCTANDVRNAVTQYPGLVIWVDGDLDIDSGGGDIGSGLQPVVIVATGQVTFSAAADIYGLVYSRASSWTLAGSGSSTVHGAIMAENDLDGANPSTVVYEMEVLQRAWKKTGSFVVEPNSWKDF